VIRPGADGEEEYPYEGQCFFIDNTIDPSTSTFLVKARIPNPEMTLLPGEYVKLKVVVDRVENGVVVPEQAVMETQAGPVVYFVDQAGKVGVQRVEAPQTYEGLRVVTKGLDSGVPVIVEGLQLVRPGMLVRTDTVELPRPVSAASDATPAKNGSAQPAAAGKVQSEPVPSAGEAGPAKPAAKTEDAIPPERAAAPKS
jgi:membrane fusion protein (multidrug efflux system)